MDIPYGSEEAKSFVTNIGIITSNGKWGHNAMTAEWVHHVSYSPGMVMINVHSNDATAENILDSKEFGVSLLSEDQGGIVRIAGTSTGKEVDKMGVLRDLGFSLGRAERIDTYMVDGARLSIECRLVKHEMVGDHMMFIGEVIAMRADASKKPILFRSKSGLFKLSDEPITIKQADASALDKAVQKYMKAPG